MKSKKISMAKRITTTIPTSLYKELKNMGFHYESDSELVRLSLERLVFMAKLLEKIIGKNYYNPKGKKK